MGRAGVRRTFTSREFNQETGKAKKAAESGPVFITDRGEAAFVLLSIAEYRKAFKPQGSILDLLYMPDAAEIDIEFPRSRELVRAADFS